MDALVIKPPSKQSDLLKESRKVLRRYRSDEKKSEQTTVGSRFMDNYVVPARVVDKVVDALASASANVDSVTLSMIMCAYLSCRQPKDAIRIFEAAVGLAADGSTGTMTNAVIKGKNGRTILPKESALNLYTATAVLQAHAVTGNVASISRVLACLEGRSGVDVFGVETAPWPRTGKSGSIQPDTECYNIAIAAATKLGGTQGMDTALALFEQMNTPSKTKDIDTYNTMISSLTKLGRSDEALALFVNMKQAEIKPDKFTYTSLIRVCADDIVQELLVDMQERAMRVDVVIIPRSP
jgi:pentatricopeptide repeat protein